MEQKINDLFDGEKRIKWYHYIIHLGYYISFWIKFFFSKPFKTNKSELNVLDKIQGLIDGETTKKNISKCKELSRLHRMIENTKARRRLEKWSLKVIATYLIIVFGIVIANYTIGLILGQQYYAPIPNGIMITILSTTTVNIIGLGLIVLRGHFLSKESTEKYD